MKTCRVNNSGLATLTGLKLLQLVDVSQCLMISDSGLQVWLIACCEEHEVMYCSELMGG